MKKKGLIISIILILVIVVTALSACGGGSGKAKKVVRIEVMSGALKDAYQLDETLDLSKAFIQVYYEDGDTEKIKLTSNMISNFDTSTNVPMVKEMTITYNSVITTFRYKVGGQEGINTNVRVLLEEKKVSDTERIIDIYLINSNVAEKPIFAMNFNIEKNQYINFKDNISNVQKLPLSWKTEAHMPDSNTVKILCYSSDGITELPHSSKLLLYSFKIHKLTGDSFIKLTNVYFSDGEKDLRAPDVNIEIR